MSSYRLVLVAEQLMKYGAIVALIGVALLFVALAPWTRYVVAAGAVCWFAGICLVLRA